MEKCLLKRGIAELFGTFVLVFIAVGAAAGISIIPEIDAFGGVDGGFVAAVALAFGLVIVAMAYTIGRVSGCHINPAVSFGAFLAKRMKLKEFLVYVGFQFLGAIIGATLLYGIFSMVAGTTDIVGYLAGTNGMIGGHNWTAGNIIGSLLVEVVLTCIFVFVILSVTAKKGAGAKAGLIIGLTLT
ncbi:MAG: aquaporin, partial [Firmicutes bacterium]|nr:aquaporin [Bacillota bacterium]